MSRISDVLYFAHGLPFRDVDWKGGRLPRQYLQRINDFYLKPAIDLARQNEAFASGLLVVCCIDATAKDVTGASGVMVRIEKFCRNIPGLDTKERAAKFCEDFRNGLVHQAMVKNGGEFSADLKTLAVEHQGRLIVNPKLLAQSVRHIIRDFVDTLYNDQPALKAFQKRLRSQFKFEIDN